MIAIQNLKHIFLRASVFITGAVVLVVEICALRILAPYYGNTIYTASSIIGIILAALAVGYYAGGWLADAYRKDSIFYGIIATAGLLIVFMQVISPSVLNFLSSVFSLASGPLISSLFLFFVPAFLLAMLSPFAIQLLSADKSKAIGRQSGSIFFWSTVGSICGSLITGFVLIPQWGINSVVIGAGTILVIWGVVNFLLVSKPQSMLFAIAGIVVIMVCFLWLSFQQATESSVIYQKDGVYEKIKVVDGFWYNRPTRFLFQDMSYSAAMHTDSFELAYEYTKYYTLYTLFNKNPAKAFIIGGGAYSIPAILLRELPDIHIDVAEIEPELFSLAQTYFSLPITDRLTNHIQDGRQFLTKNIQEYDFILSDVYYSFFSIPVHFTTKEFFALAKERLSENGIFIGNFAGTLDQSSPSFLFSEIRTFRSIFPNSYFFAVNSPSSETPQNIIFLGINGEQSLQFPEQSDDPILAGLSQKNIDLSAIDLSKYQELTDDFAPVEYLVSKIVKKAY